MGGEEVDETELMKPTDEYSGEQSAENEASVVPKVFTDLSHLTSQSPQPVQMQQPAALLAAPPSASQPPLPPAPAPKRTPPPPPSPAPKKTAQERLDELDAIRHRIPESVYNEHVAAIVKESI